MAEGSQHIHTTDPRFTVFTTARRSLTFSLITRVLHRHVFTEEDLEFFISASDADQEAAGQ